MFQINKLDGPPSPNFTPRLGKSRRASFQPYAGAFGRRRNRTTDTRIFSLRTSNWSRFQIGSYFLLGACGRLQATYTKDDADTYSARAFQAVKFAGCCTLASTGRGEETPPVRLRQQADPILASADNCPNQLLNFKSKRRTFAPLQVGGPPTRDLPRSLITRRRY